MELAILGSNQELSLSELMSLAGSQAVRRHNQAVAVLDAAPTPLGQLGGTIKQAKLLQELPTTKPKAIEEQMLASIDRLLPPQQSKLNFGVSIYGKAVSGGQARRLGLTLKQALRQRAHPVRLIPSRAAALSSAQVLHNKLSNKGVELIVSVGQTTTLVGQTYAVQDIEAYAKRDYGRPARDAKVGMLPPKLAQIMLNLANPQAGAGVLDPFCGTGVLLQEAILRGHKALGSDISKRMIDYSQRNLQWLQQEYPDLAVRFELTEADATTATFPNGVAAIVSETYLGPPLTREPARPELQKIVAECNDLVAKFLSNLHHQITKQVTICLAVPCWQTSHSLVLLPLIDQIGQIGYIKKTFWPNQPDLVYRRPSSTTGRQILVLKRK